MEEAIEMQERPQHLPTDLDGNSLKKKHGERLGLIEIELDGKPYAFVCIPADKKVLAASAKVGQSDQLAGVDVLVKNTVVWGDNTVLADIRAFLAVAEKVEAFNAPAKSSLKNL